VDKKTFFWIAGILFLLIGGSFTYTLATNGRIDTNIGEFTKAKVEIAEVLNRVQWNSERHTAHYETILNKLDTILFKLEDHDNQLRGIKYRHDYEDVENSHKWKEVK